MLKTYELSLTFIDLGFLVSPELWLRYLVCGLMLGFWLVLESLFIGGPEARARRVRLLRSWTGWQTIAVFTLVVTLWWLALYWLLQMYAERYGFQTSG